MNTPGIMSDQQFRGFVIHFNRGSIYVFSEGSEIPLLHLLDPEPLEVHFFSFATWLNRVVKIAFNCQPKDSYSNYATRDLDTKLPQNQSKHNLILLHCCKIK